MATLNVSTTYHHDIASKSSDISDVLVSLSDFYKKLSKLPIKFLRVLMSIILFPLCFFFIIGVLEVYYRKMKRTVRLNKIKIDTPNKYIDIRNSYEFLIHSIANLEKLKKEFVTIEISIGIKIIFYPIITRLKQVFDLLVPYQLVLKEALNAFDVDMQKGNFFQSVSEEELWKNRNKNYEYLV